MKLLTFVKTVLILLFNISTFSVILELLLLLFLALVDFIRP